MKDFLTFLKSNKVWWVPPIVIFLALLAFLAWQAAHAQKNPFEYRGT